MSINSEINIDESEYSYITLKIKQGYNRVYKRTYTKNPTQIYINDIVQTPIKTIYQFDYSINNVTLVWKNYVLSCQGLFEDCDKIIEINLTHFNTSKVSNMLHMFRNCKELKYLDISNIDTSKVSNMGAMFEGCESLISLDITNFDTTSCTNIGTMFKDCVSLKSINISNFNTSKIYYLDNLFNGCSNLTSIDLSNFDTSQVTQMENMFRDCISLKYINISNFDTKNVNKIENMFYGCTSLTSLEFPNFNLMNIQNKDNMENIFDKCINLEYVNIKNYIPKSNSQTYKFFDNSPKNIVICLENHNMINNIRSDQCNLFDCTDNLDKLRKKISSKGECIDNCSLTENKYEYNFKCYPNCLNGTYNNNYKCENCHEDCEICDGPFTINNTNCISCSDKNKFLYFGNCIQECPGNDYYYNDSINQNICKCELKKCKTCSIESLSKSLCTSCYIDEGDFWLYNDLNIYNFSFYDYYKSPEGYYLDELNSVYKPCYLSCKKCNISGDETSNNCLECKYDFQFEIMYGLYKNCYNICLYYSYFDEKENISFCTNNRECPINYNKLIEEKNICISNCFKDVKYKYEFRNKCYSECPPDSTKKENYDENESYFCKPICNENIPFEIIYSQECVEYCKIKELKNKL